VAFHGQHTNARSSSKKSPSKIAGSVNMQNRDLSPPTGPIAKLPIDFASIYSGILKAYWIDGQRINEDLTYTFDHIMPKDATLHIPKVVRFIHTYDDTDDISAAWCDASAGGDCPPGQSLRWEAQSSEFIAGYPGPFGTFPQNIIPEEPGTTAGSIYYLVEKNYDSSDPPIYLGSTLILFQLDCREGSSG
jgi:hypothetical protein